MKTKKIVDETTNRGEFNRVYKRYLEHKGKIRCSYCKYNKGENKKGNYYGGRVETALKYPSWKLVSKNKKQWMKKPMKIKIKEIGYYKTEYAEFIF